MRVLLAAAAMLAAAPSLAQDEGAFGVLHTAPGAEETYIYCAGCHSERLVAQQGLTREAWEKLLVWMVEEQGMPEIPSPDEEIVLDYLSEHYGPGRPHFPRAGG